MTGARRMLCHGVIAPVGRHDKGPEGFGMRGNGGRRGEGKEMGREGKGNGKGREGSEINNIVDPQTREGEYMIN